MSVIVNESASYDFELPEEGSYLGVVADVIDLGPVMTAFGTKDKVMIVWLLDAYDSEGNQFRVMSSYNKSLHEKATLRKDLKAILSADVTGSFDLETILGMNSQLVIQHNEGKSKTGDPRTYANIVAILKAPKGKKLEIPADFERKIDKDGVGSTEKPVNTAAKQPVAKKPQPTLRQAAPQQAQQAAPAPVRQAAPPIRRRAVPPPLVEEVVEEQVEEQVEEAPAPAPVRRAVAGTIRQARTIQQPATLPISDEDIPF